MNPIRIAFCAALFAAHCSIGWGAFAVQWVQIPIPPGAQTIGNFTINGKLPPGEWESWELRGTFTDGYRFGGGAIRATAAPSSAFYRHTTIDPDDVFPALDHSLHRLLLASAANPARSVSIGFAYPGNPINTSVVGALRADGTQGPVSEAVIPTGTDGTTPAGDGLISLVWVNPMPTVQPGDGTYPLVRLTFSVEGGVVQLPTIGQGSSLHVILPDGTPGPFTPIAPIPEPTHCTIIAAAIALGLRVRCR